MSRPYTTSVLYACRALSIASSSCESTSNLRVASRAFPVYNEFEAAIFKRYYELTPNKESPRQARTFGSWGS
jgi:hypothetical protein